MIDTLQKMYSMRGVFYEEKSAVVVVNFFYSSATVYSGICSRQ